MGSWKVLDFLSVKDPAIQTAFMDLNLYCIKGTLALFVLVSFLATCAR